MPTQYKLCFWNLENFFDVENSPRRSDKVKAAIGKSVIGWSEELLEKKTAQLASVIRKLNGGQGPDMLGVCEVENEYVMDLLVGELASLGRTYEVAHHDSPDERGIDVAFIYDSNLFTAEEKFDHFVMRRTATRDILQVNFKTSKGRLLVVVMNHWPSRSGGPASESAGYRAIAGETLAYFHQRIIEEKGADTPVLAMGDFNDEPFDASLESYALSTRGRTKVLKAEIYRFLDLMWPLMGQGQGTLFFDNYANLFDQFLVNKNLLKTNAAISVLPDSVEIIRFPEMVSGGDYPQPIPFGGMGKPVNENGFSDHYPVAISVQEK